MQPKRLPFDASAANDDAIEDVPSQVEDSPSQVEDSPFIGDDEVGPRPSNRFLDIVFKKKNELTLRCDRRIIQLETKL